MGKAKLPAKTQTAGKRGGKRSTSWKPGQSGNPKGAPKRGESWAEVWKRISNMTGPEVADYGLKVAAQLRTLPSTVTLKEAVVMRTMVALMNEPTPGLLNAAQDREEGTPKQSIELTGDETKPIHVFSHAAAIAALAPRSMADRVAPGADEGRGDGETVG